MKLLLVVLAACVAFSAAEVRFRRDSTDVSTMQEQIDILTESIATQSLRVGLVSNLVENTASFNEADSVANDVRFLIERSLDFASNEDIASLTETMAAAASRVQDIHTTTTLHSGSINSFSSVGQRALSKAIAENEYFDTTLSSVQSFELDLLSIAPQVVSSHEALDAALSNFDGAVEDAVDESIVVLEELFVAEEAFRTQDVDAVMSILDLPSMSNLLRTNSRDVSIFYWTHFNTYAQNYGWVGNNDPRHFGGVAPNIWGDSNGYASAMSTDMEVMRTLYRHRGVAGWNANIYAHEWYYHSSTNSEHVSVLFRIKNDLAAAVTWSPSLYHTSYGGYGEGFSVTLNGANVYQSNPSCNALCNRQVQINIQPRAISTIIFMAGSGPPSTTRSTNMAFFNNALQLPSGLSYVDDLATATEFMTPLDDPIPA